MISPSHGAKQREQARIVIKDVSRNPVDSMMSVGFFVLFCFKQTERLSYICLIVFLVYVKVHWNHANLVYLSVLGWGIKVFFCFFFAVIQVVRLLQVA